MTIDDSIFCYHRRKNKSILKINRFHPATEKNGTNPAEAVNLYRFVTEKCPNLNCHGVMTIGRFGHDYSTGPNPDFIELMKCHADICSTFEKDPEEVQVSMGMSDDYVQAV